MYYHVQHTHKTANAIEEAACIRHQALRQQSASLPTVVAEERQEVGAEATIAQEQYEIEIDAVQATEEHLQSFRRGEWICASYSWIGIDALQAYHARCSSTMERLCQEGQQRQCGWEEEESGAGE